MYCVRCQEVVKVGRKLNTMLLCGDPSHGTPLRPFGLGLLLAFSRDNKMQWQLRTVDDVILVIPKSRFGTNHIYEEHAEGKNRVAHQKYVMLW